MNELKKLFITIAVLVLSLVLLIFIGILVVNWVRRPVVEEQVTEINSRVILDRITDEYFLVTKTVFVDQESEIVIDSGTAWSNIFWGNKIIAEAMVRVDVGVDVQDLSEGNFIVDDQNKTITINVPSASILDTSLDGEIEVSTERGLFRKLNQDSNEDYNLALENLISEATIAVESDEEIFESAEGDAMQLMKLIVDDLGYEIILNNSE